MPQSPLTGQFKEKPTYRVCCLYSSFVHAYNSSISFNPFEQNQCSFNPRPLLPPPLRLPACLSGLPRIKGRISVDFFLKGESQLIIGLKGDQLIICRVTKTNKFPRLLIYGGLRYFDRLTYIQHDFLVKINFSILYFSVQSYHPCSHSLFVAHVSFHLFFQLSN
jgi:hypothetical protein